jgi:hypothetical protein
MCTARGLLRMLAAMSAPYSVKAGGALRLLPQPALEVAFCDFKASNSSRSRTNRPEDPC